MPEIERQHRSGALIFRPTLQEQLIVDTQKELEQKSKELDEKLDKVDGLIEKLQSMKELEG